MRVPTLPPIHYRLHILAKPSNHPSNLRPARDGVCVCMCGRGRARVIPLTFTHIQANPRASHKQRARMNFEILVENNYCDIYIFKKDRRIRCAFGEHLRSCLCCVRRARLNHYIAACTDANVLRIPQPHSSGHINTETHTWAHTTAHIKCMRAIINMWYSFIYVLCLDARLRMGMVIAQSQREK